MKESGEIECEARAGGAHLLKVSRKTVKSEGKAVNSHVDKRAHLHCEIKSKKPRSWDILY